MKSTAPYLLLCFILSCGTNYSQSRTIDSLFNLIKSSKQDTNKVQALNGLAYELRLNDPTKAKEYISEGMILSEKLGFKRGMSDLYCTRGSLYYNQNNNSSAIDDYLIALNLRKGLNDKSGISSVLNNIGLIYDAQADFPKALDYYLQALKIFEELAHSDNKTTVVKAKNNIAIALLNIGTVFGNQNNRAKALDYFFRSLEIAEEIEDKNIVSSLLCNIGNVYLHNKDYSKALDYHLKSLRLCTELSNQSGIARQLGRIGSVYEGKADSALAKGNNLLVHTHLHPQALFYFFKSLKIREALENNLGAAIQLNNIAAVYEKQRKFKEAESYLLRALKIVNKIGALDHCLRLEKSLSDLYPFMGKFDLAISHAKKASALKDSLFNEEKNRELTRHEMNYEFEKKTAETKAEQDKKDAVAAAEKKKQKAVLFLICCVLVLVFVFVGFVFRSLHVTRKQKTLIEIKNNETEEQKLIIEQKNKDILDSIHYAKRIQIALMPTEKYIERNLNCLQKKDV